MRIQLKYDSNSKGNNILNQVNSMSKSIFVIVFLTGGNTKSIFMELKMGVKLIFHCINCTNYDYLIQIKQLDLEI